MLTRSTRVDFVEHKFQAWKKLHPKAAAVKTEVKTEVKSVARSVVKLLEKTVEVRWAATLVIATLER